jgi:hypothetical protein
VPDDPFLYTSGRARWESHGAESVDLDSFDVTIDHPVREREASGSGSWLDARTIEGSIEMTVTPESMPRFMDAMLRPIGQIIGGPYDGSVIRADGSITDPDHG